MEPEAGDMVELNSDGEQIQGIFVQSPKKDTIIIKLESGYNIGIEKSKIKELKVISKKKHEHPKESRTHSKIPGLPQISILHTGGTIASKIDYRTGGVTARFSPEELLEMFPELKEITNINSRLVSNMWSEDMRFSHYNLLAKEAAKEAESGVDGIIITHGTDTLHYSSAALAFALQGIRIPVILVGSQRSSDRGSTDAALNLISAAYFIANSDFSGVAICMHETLSDTSCNILSPTKSRKMHTSRRDAFQTINELPIAKINFEEKKIEMIKTNYEKKNPKAKFETRLFKEKLKIGIIKTHPNMFAEEFKAYEDFDGLVIEGFALGHAPVTKIDELTAEHEKILHEIKKLSIKMPVVMSSQSIYGRLQMDVYSTGRDLQSSGVLGHLSDMTPETTFIKLAWLISNYTTEETKELISKDLRGEITKRTQEREFLN